MICEEIAQGKTLQQALDAIGYIAPTIKTVWKWLDAHPEFRERYDRARQMAADADADKIKELAQDVLKLPKQGSGHYKVAIDALRWQAEVRNRSKYGSKGEDSAKKPLDPAKIREEIARLQKELGVAENKVQPLHVVPPIAKTKP